VSKWKKIVEKLANNWQKTGKKIRRKTGLFDELLVRANFVLPFEPKLFRRQLEAV
jgi:hypothetical protein